MKNSIKQFIHFNYATFNLNNPPAGKYMLGLDTEQNKLYVYKKGKAYDISQQFAKQFLNGNKLKVQLLPNTVASKVWVSDQIKNKVSSVFILKGIKDTYQEIISLQNPNVGDVYLCRDNSAEYVYTSENSWQELGGVSSIDAQKLEEVYESLQTLSGYLDRKIELQKKRAQLVQSILSASISGNSSNIANILIALNQHTNELNSLSTNFNELEQQFYGLNNQFLSLSGNNQIIIDSIKQKFNILSSNTSVISSSIYDITKEQFTLYDNNFEEIQNKIIQLSTNINNLK